MNDPSTDDTCGLDAEPQTTVHLQLGFRFKDGSPDEITRELGVTPTSSWRYGDPHRTKNGRLLTRPWSVWSFSTENMVRSSELSAHVDHLLSVFSPVRAKISAVRPRVDYSGIWIHYEVSNYHIASFGLTAVSLAALSNLVDEVNFSIVTDGGTEQENGTGPAS